MNINTKRVLGYTRWESSCLCWHSCCRRRHGRRRGRRLSSAAEDQERRFLHADSEKVKDSQRQRPAAPAHTQVLHQRALLQPQGGEIRERTFCTITVFLALANLQVWRGWCFLLHLTVKVTMRSSVHLSRHSLCVLALAGSSWKDFLTPSFSKHSKCSRNH